MLSDIVEWRAAYVAYLCLAFFFPSLYHPLSPPTNHIRSYNVPRKVPTSNHPLISNMAASSKDFEWYNDVDDQHPIGQGPQATASVAEPSRIVPGSSVGPSDRVRQLRGQTKLAIAVTSTRASAKPRRNNTRKRRHSVGDVVTHRKSRKKQKSRVVPPDSEDDDDNTKDGSNIDDDDEDEDEDDDDGDDDGDLAIEDKSVSPSCIIRTCTDTIYYRNV
jgi:hypothetical protein